MSQEYPDAFGDAVLLVWRMHRSEIENDIQSRRAKMRLHTTDVDWCNSMQQIMMGCRGGTMIVSTQGLGFVRAANFGKQIRETTAGSDGIGPAAS